MRKENTQSIETAMDKVIRKELVRQIDEKLEECLKAPLHTLLPQEDDICIDTIAEQIIESDSFIQALENHIEYEVSMRFESVKEEQIEGLKDEQEEIKYRNAHQPKV